MHHVGALLATKHPGHIQKDKYIVNLILFNVECPSGPVAEYVAKTAMHHENIIELPTAWMPLVKIVVCTKVTSIIPQGNMLGNQAKVKEYQFKISQDPKTLVQLPRGLQWDNNH